LCAVENVIGTSRATCSDRRMPSAAVSADHRHQHCHVCWTCLLPCLGHIHSYLTYRIFPYFLQSLSFFSFYCTSQSHRNAIHLSICLPAVLLSFIVRTFAVKTLRKCQKCVTKMLKKLYHASSRNSMAYCFKNTTTSLAKIIALQWHLPFAAVMRTITFYMST